MCFDNYKKYYFRALIVEVPTILLALHGGMLMRVHDGKKKIRARKSSRQNANEVLAHACLRRHRMQELS